MRWFILFLLAFCVAANVGASSSGFGCKCDPCCASMSKCSATRVIGRESKFSQYARRRLMERRELLTFDDIIDFIVDGFEEIESGALELKQNVLEFGGRVEDFAIDLREDVTNATANFISGIDKKFTWIEDKATEVLWQGAYYLLLVTSGLAGAAIFVFIILGIYNESCPCSCCSCTFWCPRCFKKKKNLLGVNE